MIDLGDLHYSAIVLGSVSIGLGVIQWIAICIFQDLRSMPIIQKRFPNIVLVEAYMVLLILLIVFPAQVAMECSMVQHESGPLHIIVCDVITPPLPFLSLYIEATRLWLMYFQLRLMASLQNEEWKATITSSWWKSDFYMKNQANRGNPSWIGKRVAIPCIIVAMMSTFSNWYIGHYDVSFVLVWAVSFGRGILLLAPFALMLFIYWRAPKEITDNMLIRTEFTATLIVFAAFFVMFVITVPLMKMTLGSDSEISATKLMMSIRYSFFLFITTAPSFVATIWIPMKIKNDPQWNSMNWNLPQVFALKTGLFKDREMNEDGTKTLCVLDEIKNLVRCEEKMHSLAQWMVRDLTLESLLAFVELVQFKENVITTIKARNKQFSDKTIVSQRYSFYGHCPQSSIVFGGNNAMNLEKALENEDVLEMDVVEEEKEEKEDSSISSMTPVPGVVTANKKTKGKNVLEQMMICQALSEQKANNHQQRTRREYRRRHDYSLNQQNSDLQCQSEDEDIDEEMEHKEQTPNPVLEQEVKNQSAAAKSVLRQILMSNVLTVQVNQDEQDGSIVLREEDIVRLKKSARLLFKKYLEDNVDSLFQINISYEMRMGFCDLENTDYEQLSAMDWMGLYDGVIMVLEGYLAQSYRRMIQKLHALEKEMEKQ